MKTFKQLREEIQLDEAVRIRAVKTEEYDYDVEAMLEYIEDLGTQLDEISDELRQRAAKAAEDEMDKITGKYPENTTGDRSIRGVPGITTSDTNKWLKRSKQLSIFKGYTKPKVPRTQSSRDDANRRAMYGYDPDKQPVKGGKSGLGS